MKAIGRGQGGRAAVWIAMLAIFGTRTVQAGINQWTPIGPFGGSARAMAIDPQNPDTVYAGTSGGVFKTTNGGRVGSYRTPVCRRDTLHAPS